MLLESIALEINRMEQKLNFEITVTLPLPGLDAARVALATFGMSAVLWLLRAASGTGALAGHER